MRSGFNYKNHPENGKCGAISDGSKTVLFNNIDGEFNNPLYELDGDRIKEKKLDSKFIDGSPIKIISLKGNLEFPIYLDENFVYTPDDDEFDFFIEIVHGSATTIAIKSKNGFLINLNYINGDYQAVLHYNGALYALTWQNSSLDIVIDKLA